jgi:hypothetical protein
MQEAVSGFGALAGGGGGGGKRIRPNSAPPPPVPGSLALAAAAQSVALGAIRPGLGQPGGLGALLQQQHGVGGLHAGFASAMAAAAAAAAAGGAGRPGMVGGLAGLGPGAMASLPEALSRAIAAASGSAPQLMSLHSATAAAGASSGQPVVVALGAQQLATPTPPPALPLRAKMQEVRLLWAKGIWIWLRIMLQGTVIDAAQR